MVSREDERLKRGQIDETSQDQNSKMITATRLYFARYKIKNGDLTHAERIYQRIIDDILSNDDSCDHANLAVSTLLLALLQQRMGDIKETRKTFLRFFRIIVVQNNDIDECACSAKVLQAFALFEMKQGHRRKSFELVKKAVEMDNQLRPVLQWKQFRDVMKELETKN
eukprot:CAMPEP_0184865442 /NCGR_PEP_ID=MMETSP0580-20130426/18124_1 /TAXON_ID=1118495 /ORGANISM="Dactyliosolen fragilissimus" /LENGTH=167 /DNA_ID=CAMNT_0027364655 /DNA_START=283 /DNA_END=786 /DNA_ORIENTATION=-